MYLSFDVDGIRFIEALPVAFRIAGVWNPIHYHYYYHHQQNTAVHTNILIAG